MPKKQVIFVGIAHAFLAFIISRFPLFNYLGYEFSAACTFLVPFSSILTFSFLDRNTNARAVELKEFTYSLSQSIKYQFYVSAVPLGIITLNALAVKNCSYGEGLLFYIILPCVTIVFCSALAGWCWVVFRRPRLAYAGFIVLILLYPVFIGYTTPQIYSYNFIYGYFPGFSYDEVLTLSPVLIFFRIVSLLISFLLILTGRFILRHSARTESMFSKILSFKKIIETNAENFAVLGLSTFLLILWLMRTSIGFESSQQQIQRALDVKYTSEHFFLYYSPISFSHNEIRRVAAEHEFRLQQVEHALQLHFTGKIDSYIFPDAETKRLYLGTGTTNIAKPWRKEVYLNKDSWETTLKHELVHVLAGEFGMPIIKAHYHTGLVEGLATAIDGEYGNRTLHEYAAAMIEFEFVKNPEHLISPLGFMLQSSSTSYVLMGSFCRFLLDRYGILRFKELYGGKSAFTVYGKSEDQLIDDWQHFLLRIEVPEQSRSHVEFYFKRPSIFAKECARTVAKLNQHGWSKLSENASVDAMNAFSRSLHASWNTEAFSGLIRSAYQAARYDTVIQLLDTEWKDSTHQSAFINQLLLYGDALWHTSDYARAQDAYEKILTLDLSDRYNEAAALRLEGLSNSELKGTLSGYFTGAVNDSTALGLFENLHLHHPLLSYLKARIYFRQMKYEKSMDELDTVRTPFERIVLESAKEQLLGEVHFRLNDFQAARVHFWQSLNFTSNRASVERIDTWLERCTWYEANFGDFR